MSIPYNVLLNCSCQSIEKTLHIIFHGDYAQILSY